MGKTTKSQKAAEKAAVPENRPASREEKKPEKKRESRSKKEIVEPKPVPVQEPVEIEEQKVRTRRVVDRTSVIDDFDNILSAIDTEVDSLRNDDGKKRTTGIKFLRNLVKRVRILKNDASKVMKTRKTGNRPKNTTSGFMKPVNISTEMANFAGWERDKRVSRVDVTKFICDYIKRKELQNPSDRRIIVPDGKLKKLLDVQPTDDPLTYYNLQKKIQHHFKSAQAQAQA